jgi:hypothetical protein
MLYLGKHNITQTQFTSKENYNNEKTIRRCVLTALQSYKSFHFLELSNLYTVENIVFL